MLRWVNNVQVYGESPIATNGEGYFLCFEETDLLIQEGSRALMIISISTLLPQETTIVLMGQRIKISHTDNDITSEWYFDSSLGRAEWLLEIADKISSHTYFEDFEVTINTNSGYVSIESYDNKYFPEMEQTDLKELETGFQRGFLGLTESNGVEDKMKRNYYVFLKVIDNSTMKPVCDDLAVPLNVYKDDNIACFDLSAIIRQLPDVDLSKPDLNMPRYFQDKLQTGAYSIKVYGKYSDGDCGKIQTNVLEVGGAEGDIGYYFVRAIDQVGRSKFNDVYNGVDRMFMSRMPQGYKVCRDTPLFLRFYGRVTDGITGDPLRYILSGSITSSDSSATDFEIDVYNRVTDDADSNVHVVNLNDVLNDSNIYNQSKTILKIDFKIKYHISVLDKGDLTSGRTIYFDNSAMGNCCNCRKNFIFQSEAGNHDPVIGRCESQIDLDVEFTKIAKEQEVGDYNGGLVDLSVEQLKLAKTVWIYSNEWEYLVEFLKSPIKWVLESKLGNQEFVRIYPTETTYTVYKANSAGRLKFTYVESIIEKTY